MNLEEFIKQVMDAMPSGTTVEFCVNVQVIQDKMVLIAGYSEGAQRITFIRTKA